MKAPCEFGTHRVLEPPYAMPQPAWKLDNNMEIYENEVLIDVHTLNVNSVSFAQIFHECEGDLDKVGQKIMKIVQSRGKLHNPITGTGGMLIGVVKQIGSDYKNPYSLAVGDKIASLSSLSLTPLKIHRIKKIHPSKAQIDVDAEAILFQSAPVVKVPDDLPLSEVLAVLDEAGAPMQAWKLAQPRDTVLLLGAGGKLGLLCAFAVRKKLGNAGKIIGVVKTPESVKRIEQAKIFDEIIQTDALKSVQAYQAICRNGRMADLSIDCINLPGTETLSILAVRQGGRVFFANLASNYNSAALIAEGIGKDLDIYAYKGFSEGHAEFALQLLREHKKLRDMLSSRFKSNHSVKMAADRAAGPDLDAKVLKNFGLENYVFESEEIKAVLKNVLRVAMYDCTVLLTGESGVGKEIMAQASHKGSERSNSPLIKINCGSIPPNLLESEFFGYEGGAFTGARSHGKIGIFEAANGGTLFLDEIGELPMEMQVKLLRAIQEKEIYRVGGTKPIQVDVRIIAATNKNLKKMVEDGQFREDLFYRLNVFPIHIPPLRQRKADIVPLVRFFLEKYNRKFKMEKSFTPEALVIMTDYGWPGNIREMENTMQRILINSSGPLITESEVIMNLTDAAGPDGTLPMRPVSFRDSLAETELQILKEARKKYKSTREMAKHLNMSQATLIRRLKKYNI